MVTVYEGAGFFAVEENVLSPFILLGDDRISYGEKFRADRQTRICLRGKSQEVER